MPDFETFPSVVKRARHDSTVTDTGAVSDVKSVGGKMDTKDSGDVKVSVSKSELKSLSGSSSITSLLVKCDFCRLPAAKNRHGAREDLLICKDCQAKGMKRL